MAPGSNDRIEQIVSELDVQEDDRVLEIGCGHGIAVDLICQRLGTGHITAVDRSGKMIEAAKRRNSTHLQAGKVDFIHGDFETVDLPGRSFNKILAARVGLFKREPEYARSLVEPLLAPDGQLFIFNDSPKQTTREGMASH